MILGQRIYRLEDAHFGGTTAVNIQQWNTGIMCRDTNSLTVGPATLKIIVMNLMKVSYHDSL